MDTVRKVAVERHFYTAELRLAEFGEVLLIGEQPAVDRLLSLVAEHKSHDLLHLALED
jgi:hypothetical protein